MEILTGLEIPLKVPSSTRRIPLVAVRGVRGWITDLLSLCGRTSSGRSTIQPGLLSERKAEIQRGRETERKEKRERESLSRAWGRPP